MAHCDAEGADVGARPPPCRRSRAYAVLPSIERRCLETGRFHDAVARTTSRERSLASAALSSIPLHSHHAPKMVNAAGDTHVPNGAAAASAAEGQRTQFSSASSRKESLSSDGPAPLPTARL